MGPADHVHGDVDAAGRQLLDVLAEGARVVAVGQGRGRASGQCNFRLSGEPVAAMTLQPACAASSTAASPTPPAAAVINTVSPSLIRARRRNAMSAVP